MQKCTYILEGTEKRVVRVQECYGAAWQVSHMTVSRTALHRICESENPGKATVGKIKWFFNKFLNKSNSPSRNALHKLILTQREWLLKALVKSLQVIVGPVSIHRTKIPWYNSKTLIIVLSEMSSACQPLHAASHEQRIFISLSLKTLLLTRGDHWYGSLLKASVTLTWCISSVLRSVWRLLQFAWRKCLTNLVTRYSVWWHWVT